MERFTTPTAGRTSRATLTGRKVLVPDQALQWLHDKLPDPIDRSAARRQEANRFFFALVREGVVNALVHRDYSITGAKCQLVVTPDTIVIKSPGEPVAPITLEQLQSFNAPMLSRNPTLHYVFGKMELAEERGLGLKTMRESAVRAGLPLPEIQLGSSLSGADFVSQSGGRSQRFKPPNFCPPESGRKKNVAVHGRAGVGDQPGTDGGHGF